MRAPIAVALLAALGSARMAHTSPNRELILSAYGTKTYALKSYQRSADTSACVKPDKLYSEAKAGSLDQFFLGLEWAQYCLCADPKDETALCQSENPYSQQNNALFRYLQSSKNPLQAKLRQQPIRMWDDSDLEIVALPPTKEECYSWYDWVDECDAQWEAWDEYCWYEYTALCEAVYTKWYSQDIDWQTPQLPDQKCIGLNQQAQTDSCWGQWERLDQQCNSWGPYADTPYMWTEACDALEVAWELEWLVNEVRYGTDSLALLATPAATPAKAGASVTGKILGGVTAALALIGAAAYGVSKCNKRSKPSVEEAFL